mgnify:CR=1 FL=1
MDTPDVGELTPPERTLMGPGPSDVPPRVLRAMSTPLVGHLDPAFIDVMDDVQELLRYVFQTDNEYTFPVSGTGSASMEAAFTNLTEPSDTVVVPGNGYFGERMASMVRRAGGEPVVVEAPWGDPLDAEDLAAACAAHDPDLVALVHAETSTGVLQSNFADLAAIARDHGALVVADVVTSLGGVEFRTDEWGVDAAYSAAQKCLSCPPGASPLTLSGRAMDKILDREAPVRSWYLDVSELQEYWGAERAYHHTAPITNVYGLREALRLVAEEGIENCWARHERVAGAIKAGVEGMGLGLNPDPAYWLPTLNAVVLPDGVDDDAVIEYLLEEHAIEVAAGLGSLSGDVLRVGCMGHSARPRKALATVVGLGEAFEAQDADVDVAAGIEAARAALDRTG